MTRISTLARAASAPTGALMLAALIALTTGCSGGGGGSTAAAPQAPADNPPSSAPIEGVATPSSVAVVTATNAQ